jgi:glycosyltransferase involved in cell wall biosynthesis
MQKTTFPIELVIGEDCSTDGTREIVQEYAQKYPEIIQVITSDANVGALKNSIRTNLACRGEYIAYCEGDDYWIDPLKLQKQYDAIIKYDAVLVAHSTIMVYYQDGKMASEPKMRRAKEESGFLDLEDILSHRTLFHTSSIFLRAEIMKHLPDWYFQMALGDYPLKVISAQMGKIYYLDEIMSVYQKGVSGSFTDRTISSNIQEMERELGELKMYPYLDEYTGYKFTNIIHKYLEHRKVMYYASHGNLDYLDLSEFQKNALRSIGLLFQRFPFNKRKMILGKILKYMRI